MISWNKYTAEQGSETEIRHFVLYNMNMYSIHKWMVTQACVDWFTLDGLHLYLNKISWQLTLILARTEMLR